MTNAKGFKSLFFLAVAVVLAFSSLLLLNLNAENADANNRFNGDKIVLPVVLEGHLQYAMELRRERPGSISFVVLQKDKIEYTPANQAAVLENGILRVPAIQDGNDFF